MNFKLKIGTKGFSDDGSGGKRFSFAVVDLNRSESYPQNFVCMLPVHIRGQGKTESVFQRVFGETSVEQAKVLLADALETEDDPEVRAEIERRLKLLEPKLAIQVKCSACGKLFQPRQVRRYGRNFCPDCMKKRYGNRE
jgi:hypothetical protein